MEQKIENLQQLIDWIEDNDCRVFDKEEDNFTIEAPNNATWQIQFKKDDDIDEIVYKTIVQLEEFDAEERFTEWWSREFAEHNHFKPSQFLKMLQDDENFFHSLARRLNSI